MTFLFLSELLYVGIDELLEAIVRELPPPPAGRGASNEGPLRALVFDSFYDPSKGVVLVAVLRVSTDVQALLGLAILSASPAPSGIVSVSLAEFKAAAETLGAATVYGI